MKLYIIMKRASDCEGKHYGEPQITKIFLNKENAEKFLEEMKKKYWDYFWMEEKEAE